MTPGPTALPARGGRRRRPPDPLLALVRVHRDLGGRRRAPARRLPDRGRGAGLRRLGHRRHGLGRRQPRAPGASGCWWPRAATSATAGRSICADYGVDALHLEGEWGRPIDPAAVAEALAGEPGIEVVFVTQSETSTGAVSDLPALREAAGDRILVADAVSGLGVVDLPMDRWGHRRRRLGLAEGPDDAAGARVRGGERAGDRALRRARAGRLLPRLGAHPQGRLAQPVHAAGHARLPAPGGPAPDRGRGAAERLRPPPRARPHDPRRRAGERARRCSAPRTPRPTSSRRSWSPRASTGKAIQGDLKRRFGIQIAGGQGKLSGKICRIGHCGYYDYRDILTAARGARDRAHRDWPAGRAGRRDRGRPARGAPTPLPRHRARLGTLARADLRVLVCETIADAGVAYLSERFSVDMRPSACRATS